MSLSLYFRPLFSRNLSWRKVLRKVNVNLQSRMTIRRRRQQNHQDHQKWKNFPTNNSIETYPKQTGNDSKIMMIMEVVEVKKMFFSTPSTQKNKNLRQFLSTKPTTRTQMRKCIVLLMLTDLNQPIWCIRKFNNIYSMILRYFPSDLSGIDRKNFSHSFDQVQPTSLHSFVNSLSSSSSEWIPHPIPSDIQGNSNASNTMSLYTLNERGAHISNFLLFIFLRNHLNILSKSVSQLN